MADTELVPLFETAVLIESPIKDQIDLQTTWSKAMHQWLDELPSENTRRAYRRAWNDFLTFTKKKPWDTGASAIFSEDVLDWIRDLETRPLNKSAADGLIRKGRRKDRYGYSPSTIGQYLAGISSFYTFVMERFLIWSPEGQEMPLHQGINPAKAVRRPKINAFGKADYLDADAMTAIIHVIPRDTVQGLRDLALLLGYMLTGRRNSEWRNVQWGDFERRASKTMHRWSGKGKEDQLHELAPPVWDAIKTYLKAAGRWDSMQDEDYIFTPLTNVATRLPNVSELTWTTNRALSLGHCNDILKKYAKRAEIDPTRVTIHTLRHSFAMLLSSLGVDVMTISKRLAHSNLNITMVYLDHMKGVEDHSWRQVAASLKLDIFTNAETDADAENQDT